MVKIREQTVPVMPGGQLQTKPFGANWFSIQVPPSRHGFGSQDLAGAIVVANVGNSQLAPMKFDGQTQVRCGVLLIIVVKITQFPPFWHGFGLHGFVVGGFVIKNSHLIPKKFVGQIQVYTFQSWALQMPPFWHGFGLHTWLRGATVVAINCSQRKPWKLKGQLQLNKLELWAEQTPPLRQGFGLHTWLRGATVVAIDCSQRKPWKLKRQLQLNKLKLWAKQTPPLRHGFGKHGLFCLGVVVVTVIKNSHNDPW